MAHEWWHWGDDEWDTFRYDGPPDIQIPSQDYNIPETDWGSQESISFGDTDDYVYQTPSQQYDTGSYQGDFDSTYWDKQQEEHEDQLETQSFLDAYGIDEEELKDFGAPGGEAWDIQPEEQSYASIARGFIDDLAPWLGGAAKLQKFAKGMTTQRQRQGGGGGGGRQVKAPYTTHKAGTSGRTQANIQSSFQGRDSRQLMSMLSQQSRQAASGVQIVANKAADVGDPIKGNDLYDLISGETKPLGAKQQLPTGQSFRSLSIRRTQRA